MQQYSILTNISFLGTSKLSSRKGQKVLVNRKHERDSTFLIIRYTTPTLLADHGMTAMMRDYSF